MTEHAGPLPYVLPFLAFAAGVDGSCAIRGAACGVGGPLRERAGPAPAPACPRGGGGGPPPPPPPALGAGGRHRRLAILRTPVRRTGRGRPRRDQMPPLKHRARSVPP